MFLSHSYFKYFSSTILYNKIQNIPDIADEIIEIAEDTTYSIVTQNPLNELMIDDDPFESEFDIYN